MIGVGTGMSPPPVIFHTHQQVACRFTGPVGEAHDCFHQIVVAQRVVLLSLELNIVRLASLNQPSELTGLHVSPPYSGGSSLTSIGCVIAST